MEVKCRVTLTRIKGNARLVYRRVNFSADRSHPPCALDRNSVFGITCHQSQYGNDILKMGMVKSIEGIVQ
jgi:hypothetical protein